jgi:hypothetical protein
MNKQWRNNKKERSLTPKDSKIVIAADDEQEHQQDEELIDMPRRSPRNTETLIAILLAPMRQMWVYIMSQKYKVDSKHCEIKG